MKKIIKTFVGQLNNAYICKVKKRMFCPNCRNEKMTINKKSGFWICEHCGYKLSDDRLENKYAFWFCDECQAYLNNQEGFDSKSAQHICRNCGYENDIAPENLKRICRDCGRIITNTDRFLCFDCRQKHKEKAKDRLKKAGKIAGTVAAVAGIVYLASRDFDDEDKDYTPLIDYDTEGDFIMKCANCGNTDENTLWDEDDTVYCSRCYHRTLKESGKDDLVECPYCHRMRDRKAMYCRYCNDTSRQPSTPEEFEEIDSILKESGY